jgi:hypothetical protein
VGRRAVVIDLVRRLLHRGRRTAENRRAAQAANAAWIALWEAVPHDRHREAVWLEACGRTRAAGPGGDIPSVLAQLRDDILSGSWRP